MKAIFTFILCLCMASNLVSQSGKTAGTIDTLNMYQQRASGYVLQNVTGGGYVFGTSNDGSGNTITIATGLHFDSLGPITVNEVFVWVGAKQIVGSSNNVKLELYNAASDSLPTNLVGFGVANMAFVDSATSGVNFVTMNNLTKFTINQGTNLVTGPFVVALNYDQIDDTIGIVCSNPDSGDGQGERRAKQLLGPTQGGGWAAASDIWLSGIDADPIMIPIVETTTIGTEPVVFANEHYRIRPPFPNPSRNLSTFEIELLKDTHLQLVVWDIAGKILFDSGNTPRSAGKHVIDIDVSDLATGSYYYTVGTDETRMSGKMVVSR